VVVDEQHRFGVEQRAKVLRKSQGETTPHLLTLTATPIPRTLALTVYSDLDLSTLDELPPGRKRVKTFVVPSYKRSAGYEWVKKQLGKGEQAFVICPLIEESEKETMQQVKAAAAEFERIKSLMQDVNVGLLHGRMTAKEKSAAMEAFKAGKTQLLVSTPVVEVGIDVPNATIMIVEAAERFGLASLHQLRGRVGRGEKESYCFLFTENPSPRVHSRLGALEGTSSGFELAELDLKLRGPGEMYGVRQHGLLKLKAVNLADTAMLKRARDAAQETMKENPELRNYATLKRELSRFSSFLVDPN
jgi:ATP-dependent DNA helicase RecG